MWALAQVIIRSSKTDTKWCVERAVKRANPKFSERAFWDGTLAEVPLPLGFPQGLQRLAGFGNHLEQESFFPQTAEALQAQGCISLLPPPYHSVLCVLPECRKCLHPSLVLTQCPANGCWTKPAPCRGPLIGLRKLDWFRLKPDQL